MKDYTVSCTWENAEGIVSLESHDYETAGEALHVFAELCAHPRTIEVWAERHHPEDGAITFLEYDCIQGVTMDYVAIQCYVF